MIADSRTEVDTAEQIQKFVECIYDPQDIVEIRFLPSGASDWVKAAALPEAALRLTKANGSGSHIHIGLNPRKQAGGRSAETVALARVLWADCDDTTVEAVQFRLRETSLPSPTLTITSGHGVHLYWRLETPITDLAAWEQYQRDLAALLGSDPAIHDPPRLTRLPGFVNHKEPAAECSIVEAVPERVYPLDELQIPPTAKPTHVEVVPQADTNGQPRADDLSAIARAARYAEKWEAAGEGERNTHATRHAACLTRDFALTAEQALPILTAWNSKNASPLPDDELRTCLSNGRRYGTHEVGEKRTVQAQAAEPPPRAIEWPGPLDEAAYHGPAGEIVRRIEPATEADPAALLACFLIAFGNCCKRRVYFLADGARHHLNLFGVLVGETSKGRKGTSWARIRTLFCEIAQHWADTCVKGGLSSGEGLIWQVRDPIFGVNDAGETICKDPGVDDKRLMIVEAEFASVLRAVERSGNTLSEIIRRAWESGKLQALTKNSPAKATDAHVSIIGQITTAELRRYLDRTDVANGFGNRFLWCCVRRSKCLPEGGYLDDDAFADLTPKIADALDFASHERRLQRNADAKALWANIYPQLSEGKSGMVGELTGRAEAQVMRLAAVYAVLDCSPLITVEHLTAAVALWEYCEASVRWCFGDASGDPTADAITEALRAAGDQGMTRTEVSALFGRNVDASKLTRALATLKMRGLAHEADVQTGGRPAERWFAGNGTA